MALPLEGIRVLDLASMLAGPYGATMLGDMGADVVKVEPPQGDESRTLGPRVGDDSGLYVGINRNKRSLILDLAKPEGRGVYYRLVKTADIVVENLRADAEQKLGVSYEDTVAHNPRIIYISVSTFGESGPYAGRPGTDPLAQALTGFMSTTGETDGPPLKAGVAVADATCANLVAFAAMVGLWVRQTQGIGQRIELSLIDGLVHLQPGPVGMYAVSNYQAPRVGNGSPFYTPYNTYTCADGREVIIALFSDKWFAKFCQAIGHPELLDKPDIQSGPGRCEHRDQWEPVAAAWFAGRSKAQATDELLTQGLPVGPVQNAADMFADPHPRARQMLPTIEDPIIGPYQMAGAVPRLSASEPQIASAPRLGEHTETVLQSLGYTRERIAALRQAEGI